LNLALNDRAKEEVWISNSGGAISNSGGYADVSETMFALARGINLSCCVGIYGYEDKVYNG
jgi:hypothetical protein